MVDTASTSSDFRAKGSSEPFFVAQWFGGALADEPTPEQVPDSTPPAAEVEARLIGGARQPVPAKVRSIAVPVVEGLGLSLVGVELAQEGTRIVLWVYIDGPEGVTIDDCARVSPELSAALDVDDPIPTAYDLRVSSPGLDRPLMSDADFRRFIGREAQIQLSSPIGGRRRFTGVILGAEESVQIRCTDGEHQVPVEAIQKARLCIDLEALRPKPQAGAQAWKST
ncbi:MAG: ribosome maturation factor RimP [Myxococcales bacterium]|nr:ribosome maturation factor RimP [Myxococcales bacterium]